jgi:2-amino-4-hydroxy-6-hydroxymethyldihydropteridine diphosphokinase
MEARAGVFLGLGSNVGDREANLEQALRRLEARGFRISGRSSFYLTEPVGGPPQDWYVNMVVRGATSLSPEALLAVCLETEALQGRTRSVRNGPRPIDVDVLLMDDRVVRSPGLTVPHPRLHQRRFVLVPLAELDPAATHPLLGLTVGQLLARCPDDSRVLLHAPAPAPRP